MAISVEPTNLVNHQEYDFKLFLNMTCLLSWQQLLPNNFKWNNNFLRSKAYMKTLIIKIKKKKERNQLSNTKQISTDAFQLGQFDENSEQNF